MSSGGRLAKLALGVLVVVATPAANVAHAAPSPPAPPSPDVVIDGKGWGHGVGMSQDGALAMGVAGASTDQILDAFYPGTTIGHKEGAVDVTLFEGAHPGAVTVMLPSGGQLRDGGDGAPGFPISVSPGGSVRLAQGEGRLSATPLSGATAADMGSAAEVAAPETPTSAATAGPVAAAQAPPSTQLLLGLIPVPVPPAPVGGAPAPGSPAAPAPSSDQGSPVPVTSHSIHVAPSDGSGIELPDQGRRYGGTMDAVASGGIQMVNHIDVEHYLRGMGEVRDPGWPAASLRAQAIAARTYALRAPAAGNTLCSNDQCQVYLGETAEYSAMNAAVADTAGEVLLYHGGLALAVYSASGGGVSATPEEGFGTPDGDVPYLRSRPYPTQDPQAWTVRVPLRQLANRVGYRGDVTGVRVSRAGPSGRALEVSLDGPEGSLAVDGRNFARILGLKSTLFTVRVDAEPVAGVAGLPRSAVPASSGAGSRTGLMARDEVGVLGRSPWVALAVLLLAGCGLLGFRVRASRQSR